MYDSFVQITNNGNPSVAEQLSVEVTDLGEGGTIVVDGTTISVNRVVFTFRNTAEVTSSITDVYFDDGSLFGIAEVTGSPGTSFSHPATPGDLPGWNTVDPPFDTTDQFSADASTTPNGVDAADEWVGIIFNLQPGEDFDDVLTALGLGFTNPTDPGSLRIGIHIQGFDPIPGTSASESFVLVPLPAGILLGMLGLGYAGWRLRRCS
jgi:hypothetical protein